MFKLKERLPLIFMGASLLLLLVFIFLWLQRVYKDEYKALEKEADLLFVNSVKGLENDLFKKMYTKARFIKVDDSLGLVEVHTTLEDPVWHSIEKKDSGNVRRVIAQAGVLSDTGLNADMIFPESLNLPFGLQDTSIQNSITISVQSPDDEKGHFGGALSLFLKLEGATDTIDAPGQGEFVMILKERFDQTAHAASSHLPDSYQVILLSDTTLNVQKIRSKSYTDISSGNSYAVLFSEYKPFLLKKITPQILFSLLLFFSVAFAFFLVYRSLQNQRKLTALKNDFISNVTHELKTPITTVSVAIEALSDFGGLEDPQQTREYLNISKFELSRLSILVDKVLKMSLFERAEPILELETINMEQLTREILNSMKLQFKKYSAQVDFNTSGDDFNIQADPVHMTSVIYNLLDNALKYSPDAPHIRIDMENRGEQLFLAISDEGIGIPEAFSSKIFEKFFRVPTGDAHNVKGHGLGLSYVASVVQRHGGSIRAKNRKEGGARFEIFLPKGEKGE